MENKNKVFKKIFLTIFSACLLFAGIFFNVCPTNGVLAENTQSESLENKDIPPYFSVSEKLKTDGNVNPLTDAASPNALTAFDTFMFDGTSENSNYLSLSLITGNGKNLDAAASGVYNYVYYPDPENHSVFNFFTVINVGLNINGAQKEIYTGNFCTSSPESFINQDAELDRFNMIFSDRTTTAAQNEICILDEAGKVVEGVYSLSLTLALYTCTDGNLSATEEMFSDRQVTINYNFYVIDRQNYILNGAAKTTNANFDSVVPVTNATNPRVSSYLFSNYSAKGSENKIPYVEYDFTRYEMTINKEQNSTTTSSLVYDLDTKSVLCNGNDVSITTNGNMCKVFFYDVGDYKVSLNAIKLVDFTTAEGVETKKFDLPGVTSVTKNLDVDVFGYQATYTNLDLPADENNVRQTSELKQNDFESGTFSNSADITSAFLNSKTEYSQANASTTFVISNVANFINGSLVTPVKTNQTPIKFDVNATLNSKSYVYATTKISNAYTATSYKIGEQTLYRANFTGRTESTTGKYIYILAYTYKNFYTSESTLAANQVFYQVFYFEIVKDLPKIEVFTGSAEDGSKKAVSSDTFVNKDVTILDTTENDIYNKDVTIQIYAKAFGNGGYLSEFGGENGISFENYKATFGNTLSQNAHYTIRLFFTNEMPSLNTQISATSGFFREQTFTIDKTPIENITGFNASEILNSTDYEILNPMEEFVTNQSFALSWDEKASGAQTYAYYRFFPLVETKYYSNNAAVRSNTLNILLNYSATQSYLPVEYTLDMTTTDNSWLPYKGRIGDVTTQNLPNEYVLTDAGLYVVDVYDKAGNHTVKTFMLDNTRPLFAYYDTAKRAYDITSPSMFVTNNSILYWSKNKSIVMTNFETPSFSSRDLDEATLSSYGVFKDFNGKTSTSIYQCFYDNLFANHYLQKLSNLSITHGEDSGLSQEIINSYKGYYITLPINPLSYYMETNLDDYQPLQDVFSMNIETTKEKTLNILIRDLANTKRNFIFPENSAEQYKSYFSAKQTIIVSFDSSEFFIEYEDEDRNVVKMTDGRTEETVDEMGRKVKTEFLNPTRMNKAFTLSFLPTITNEDGSIIQVDTVTMKFTPFTTKTIKENGITYFYRTLSDNTTEITVYNSANGASTTVKKEEIRLNADNRTTEGKYEITRTYLSTGSYSYNENDFFSRTYVLYVDRNEVITNPELVSDEEGNSHLESLVGGDVFVAMYDNKTNADLVVTFPNSAEGNTKGSSLYNSGTTRPILSTNMFPVYIYIPQYKYTTFVSKTLEGDGEYDFVVTNNDQMNSFSNGTVIGEYSLFAEIYKDGTRPENLFAISSSNVTTPSLSNITTNKGFLEFYTLDSQKLNYLSQEGRYYVKVSQGLFGSSTGENRYEQSLTFCFDIIKTDPNFIAQAVNGSALNSTDDAAGKTTYHTNQASVNLMWEVGDDYLAEIDFDKTTFVARESATSAPKTFTAKDDIFIGKLEHNSNFNIRQISFEKMGIYNDGAVVEITMQYKNHNDLFYNKVSKRISLDLSAPSTNVQNLVASSTASNMFTPLTNDSLRTYYTAKNERTTHLDNTSYNISNGNGDFAYYAYAVTADYLQTLRSSQDFLTYVRKFNDKYQVSQTHETAPADFLPNNFERVSNVSELEAHNYYEVVETDLAGNMSIYTIYVISYDPTEDEQNNLITYVDGDGQNKTYTIDDLNLTKTYEGASANIYSKPGMTVTNFNFFGDAWAQMRYNFVNQNGYKTSTYVMLTPWDEDNVLTFVGSNVSKVEKSKVVNGALNSRFKSSLNFFNRQNGSMTPIYINTRIVTLSPLSRSSAEKENISFTLPTASSISNTTYASTYLTKMKISVDGQVAPVIFDQTNKLGYGNLWTSTDDVIVTYVPDNGMLTFELNPQLNFTPNTRIIYEFEDNYGAQYKELHLFKESIIRPEISTLGDSLYSYDNTSNGRRYYLTKDNFQYHYNDAKYDVDVYDLVGQTIQENLTKASTSITKENGVCTLTISTIRETPNYCDNFAIVVKDLDGNTYKTIYLTLYNELPTANLTTQNNAAGEFKILDVNGNNITSTILSHPVDDERGYFSEVRVVYSKAETFIPIKYSISTDSTTWTELVSGTRLRSENEDMQTYYLKIWYDEQYLLNKLSGPTYVFGDVDEDQIFRFNLSSLKSTYWIEKTVNGQTEIVEKSDKIFKNTLTGTKYSNHYIVNLSYNDRDLVQIKTNKEQQITATLVDTFQSQTSNVYSELWSISNPRDEGLGNIPAFDTNIVITYIPKSDNFVGEFYTYNMSGIIDTSENLVNLTSKSVVVSDEYTNINKIELQWSKFNGIEENEINIKLVKDGIALQPIEYTKTQNGKEYKYIYLTYSGKYIISLEDSAGNVQKFNFANAGQSDTLTFVFLKDVPFTLTYTDIATGETKTTAPTKQAIYNGRVTLNIDRNSRAEYYSQDGFPSISVLKNGHAYTGAFQDDTTYTFDEAGFYEVTFSAKSNILQATSGSKEDGLIRKETYTFTILDANEHRFSYGFNKYANYYIERIVKDDVDVTDIFTAMLDNNKITVNKKQYLTELALSYLDEKTGAGKYLITINSNEEYYIKSPAQKTWTYQVIIQNGSAPVRVSLARGEATTDKISVTFNNANVFAEMGSCTLRVVKETPKGLAVAFSTNINAASASEVTTHTIDDTGIYYIQIVAPSGVLWYSYKVEKQEPLNAAAIIAIVISALVLVAVIFIVIKLRKRIAIK